MILIYHDTEERGHASLSTGSLSDGSLIGMRFPKLKLTLIDSDGKKISKKISEPFENLTKTVEDFNDILQRIPDYYHKTFSELYKIERTSRMLHRMVTDSEILNEFVNFNGILEPEEKEILNSGKIDKISIATINEVHNFAKKNIKNELNNLNLKKYKRKNLIKLFYNVLNVNYYFNDTNNLQTHKIASRASDLVSNTLLKNEKIIDSFLKTKKLFYLRVVLNSNPIVFLLSEVIIEGFFKYILEFFGESIDQKKLEEFLSDEELDSKITWKINKYVEETVYSIYEEFEIILINLIENTSAEDEDDIIEAINEINQLIDDFTSKLRETHNEDGEENKERKIFFDSFGKLIGSLEDIDDKVKGYSIKYIRENILYEEILNLIFKSKENEENSYYNFIIAKLRNAINTFILTNADISGFLYEVRFKEEENSKYGVTEYIRKEFYNKNIERDVLSRLINRVLKIEFSDYVEVTFNQKSKFTYISKISFNQENITAYNDNDSNNFYRIIGTYDEIEKTYYYIIKTKKEASRYFLSYDLKILFKKLFLNEIPNSHNIELDEEYVYRYYNFFNKDVPRFSKLVNDKFPNQLKDFVVKEKLGLFKKIKEKFTRTFNYRKWYNSQFDTRYYEMLHLFLTVYFDYYQIKLNKNTAIEYTDVIPLFPLIFAHNGLGIHFTKEKQISWAIPRDLGILIKDNRTRSVKYFKKHFYNNFGKQEADYQTHIKTFYPKFNPINFILVFKVKLLQGKENELKQTFLIHFRLKMYNSNSKKWDKVLEFVYQHYDELKTGVKKLDD